MDKKTLKTLTANKGFTLVELIVVVAILGVLMAVLVPKYIQYTAKSRAAVCNSNCAEAEHEVDIASVAAGGALTLSEARAIVTSHSKICPENGRITVELNVDTDSFTVNCSIHGAHPNQQATDIYEIYKDLFENSDKYTDYNTKDYGYGNDGFRNYFIQNFTKNKGQWDSITCDGKIFYIQPYVDAVNDANGASGDVYIYANVKSSGNGNWNANLIYNHENKTWYASPDGRGMIGFANKAWAEVKQMIADKGWHAVEVEYK